MSIFKSLYDHKLIKKYHLTFGSLFDQMVIIRKSLNGNEQERYKIPIAYNNKEKFIQRIMSDANLTNQEGMTYPRFGYEAVDYRYNPERKLSSKLKVGIPKPADANNKIAFLNPVAYDITYNLYIGTKTETDLYQIIEQIFPAFTPDYTVSLKVFYGVDNFHVDIPISLVSNSLQDNYTGDIGEKRNMMWQLSFIMKVYFFGPVKDKPIIKQTNFEVKDLSETTEFYNATFMPYIDGVPLDEIYETDDWDIIKIHN